MRDVIDYTGVRREMACIGCYCHEQGWNAPGSILVTDLFHVHQDHEVPIPGFVIISTRRHIESIDQMTAAEINEFTAIIRTVRTAQRRALGIEKVYLIQEEDTQDHFHLWMLPRYSWMDDVEKFGRKISSARPVLAYAKEHLKTPEHLAEVAMAVGKLKAYIKSG